MGNKLSTANSIDEQLMETTVYGVVDGNRIYNEAFDTYEDDGKYEESYDIYEDDEIYEESYDIYEDDGICVRLACGKIETYYGYHTYSDGYKILTNKEGRRVTGPFNNLERMIVNTCATAYRYVKPYEKDIDGTIIKRDTGELSV